MILGASSDIGKELVIRLAKENWHVVITRRRKNLLEAAAPASKAYQIMYLDSLRKRSKKENVNCCITELRPGSVDTEMMKGEGHFWISTPKHAAELAYQAICKRKRLQYISRKWSFIGLILRCLSILK